MSVYALPAGGAGLPVWLTGAGKATPDSDVDVLVELEKGVGLFQFIRTELGLEDLLKKSVDLVSTGGLSPHIKPYIDADKILIYEKAN